MTWQPQVSFVATENEWWRFCLSCLKLGFRLAIAFQVQNFTILFLFLVVLFLFIFASYFSLKISKWEFRLAAASQLQNFAILFLFLVGLLLFIFAPCFCLKISKLGFMSVTAIQVQNFATLLLFLASFLLFNFAPYFCLKISLSEFASLCIKWIFQLKVIFVLFLIFFCDLFYIREAKLILFCGWVQFSMDQETKELLWHGNNTWLERTQVYLLFVSSCRGGL